jgi:DNA polymerase II small subunit
MGNEAPMQLVNMIISRTKQTTVSTVISKSDLAAFLRSEHIPPQEKSKSETRKESALIEERPEEPSHDVEKPTNKISVIKNPTFGEVGSSGSFEDFLALFTDRFDRIKKIYTSRIDTRNSLTPGAAKKHKHDAQRWKALAKEGGRSSRPPKQKVIGMIRNKRTSRSRNIIVELEDEDDSIICVIPSNREGFAGAKLVEKGNSLLLDEVVCISGYIDQDGRMIADDILYPDIPTTRPAGRSDRDVYAAFISDIHYGSIEFLEDEFDQFIDWLSGKDVDPEDKDTVNSIEYLFIAGDIVDGIGVYPTQQDNLLVPDLYDQYKTIAQKIENIPDRIQVIIIPGNHDASRQALPKPPISEFFAKPLYDLKDQVMLLGDPAVIRVEGVEVLLTHGDSLDDLVVNTPGASYKDPAVGMKELLQKRHLVPLYGGKTELAPLHRDWMVIDTPPDIVHFGHAHHNAVDNYRGIQIINSGTFQAQTDFMRKQGIVPTPGIVTLINLRTGAPQIEFFYDMAQLDR